MEEIAKEYDVIVLGTGELHQPPTPSFQVHGAGNTAAPAAASTALLTGSDSCRLDRVYPLRVRIHAQHYLVAVSPRAGPKADASLVVPVS